MYRWEKVLMCCTAVLVLVICASMWLVLQELHGVIVMLDDVARAVEALPR
jgi:hypothetical protein